MSHAVNIPDAGTRAFLIVLRNGQGASDSTVWYAHVPVTHADMAEERPSWP